MADEILDRSWRAAEFAVVDLETSGLDPAQDEILSFAAIPVRAGRVVPAELVATLVAPRRPPAAESIRIHGLREADLRGQQPLEPQLDRIAGALEGRILVAHFAWIEHSFLERVLPAERPLGPHLIDTMQLGRAVITRDGGGCPEYPSLGQLAELLNLPVHRPHHADGDALTTAQVFIALASRLDRVRDATVGELLSASRPRRRGPGAGALRRLFSPGPAGPGREPNARQSAEGS